MKPETPAKPKGLPGDQVAKASELVNYQDGAVVSREIVKRPTGSVTLFAFDEGQGLSETHSSIRRVGASGRRRGGNQHRWPAASLAGRRDDSHARRSAACAQGAQAVQDDSHDDSILNHLRDAVAATARGPYCDYRPHFPVASVICRRGRAKECSWLRVASWSYASVALLIVPQSPPSFRDNSLFARLSTRVCSARRL